MPVRLGVRPKRSAGRVPVLAERGRRQHCRSSGHRAHDVGDEGVRVRARPGAVAAPARRRGSRRRRRAPAESSRSAACALDRDDELGRVPEPAPVRRPAVGAHRAAPADLVVAGVAGGALLLDDDPGVVREDAFPAPGAGGVDADERRGLRAGRRQEPRARPVGAAPVRRAPSRVAHHSAWTASGRRKTMRMARRIRAATVAIIAPKV